MCLNFLVYICKITWEANIATENRYQDTIFILLDIYFLKFFFPLCLLFIQYTFYNFAGFAQCLHRNALYNSECDFYS